MEEKKFLEVKDLGVIYTSEGKIVRAVNGVSFSLDRAKTLALVGETGAGKTTIARTILRILPDRAAKITGGSISFDGQEILSLSEKEMGAVRGNRISMVFQDPMTALNPVMKVGKQISEAVVEHMLSALQSPSRAGIHPMDCGREYLLGKMTREI